ncbi:N-acetylglutamate synthase, CG3035 family [Phytoactinopolyspora mesophila]|uniref:GNAT family N-acetyltransferase n=1 Tax=Phytoactinopolyspora mesophila TaxID=2650750 RepID=A0A7K3M9T9_9ACTN|nr:GNAT family N-acetyltransferase [Phytoactinopolyspora mesophila]NDL59767.1 GNAT family N-acetyltransferase [Phytoactinopolyspora mesophila]
MRQHHLEEGRARLLGRRVVVRYRLHNDTHSATDVLGILETWADGVLRVRRDRAEPDDTPVTIAEPDVIAIKAIPARPVTNRDIRDLEAAAAQGWQGLEIHHIEGWILRAAGGFTRRANSCLPLGDPGQPLDDAIAAVEQWYRDRALAPTFQIPDRLAGALGHALDARGWSHDADVIVMTAPVDDVRRGTKAELPAVRVDPRPDDAWLGSYHYRGGDLPPHGIDVLTNADTVGFASVDDGGQRVAIARGAVTDAPSGRRWLGVTAVEVAPHARRRGLGSHIVAGLAEWAANHDASDAYLQVEEINTVAQATYRKLGFGDHHSYHYRQNAHHTTR